MSRAQVREYRLNCAQYSIQVIEGRFPLDEINKLLANGSYGAGFLEKLASGAMLPISYFPESPTVDTFPGSIP